MCPDRRICYRGHDRLAVTPRKSPCGFLPGFFILNKYTPIDWGVKKQNPDERWRGSAGVRRASVLFMENRFKSCSQTNRPGYHDLPEPLEHRFTIGVKSRIIFFRVLNENSSMYPAADEPHCSKIIHCFVLVVTLIPSVLPTDIFAQYRRKSI